MIKFHTSRHFTHPSYRKKHNNKKFHDAVLAFIGSAYEEF
jgi:hypothetical protein